MIGETNVMGSGGGFDKAIAAIKVTFPEGARCTCTDGKKMLRAKSGVTEWFFPIPTLGTWTVTVADGEDKVSEAVEITKAGQVETVTLKIKPEIDFIISEGELQSGYTIDTTTATYELVDGGLVFKSTVASSGNGSIQINANGQDIDLLKYKSIVFDVEATSPRSGTLDYVDIGLSNGRNVTKNLGVDNPVPRQEITLDLSSVTSGAIKLFISDNPATVELKIYNIWFVEKETFYLFKSGEGVIVPLKTFKEDSQCYVDVSSESISKGWQSNNRVTSFSTENKIDLTDYYSLVIEYTCSDPGSGNYAEAFGISTVPAQGGVSTAILNTSRKTLSSATSKTVATLDISSLSGEYYIGVCGAGKSSVYNWYLV